MVTPEVDLTLLPLLLVLLPLATAVILLLTRDASFRNLLVKGSAAVMMGLALAVAVTCFDEPVKIGVDSELLKAVMPCTSGIRQGSSSHWYRDRLR